ncbi:MAG TPA: GMC oxidoreductase, partial [Hypericibacter adhaerens]|uniref:GMC oxidoreductase n=1 Tax=Hypericibacter adhaerens TaxID=2602016 RepID=UPI002C1B6068
VAENDGVVNRHMLGKADHDGRARRDQCAHHGLHFQRRREDHREIGAQWLATRKGLGASNFFEAGGFLRSAADIAWPDVQLHFVALAADYSGRATSPGHSYQVHLGPQRSLSRGTVTLRSSSPEDPPVIQPNFLAVPEDWAEARAAIRASRHILEQPALRAYRGAEIRPGARADRDDTLDEYIRENAETGYHFVGTCRMGSGPDAVVDGQLRVHGIEALRVIDASVMPEATNGNTNAPTIMIAERGADFIMNRALPRSDAPFYRIGAATRAGSQPPVRDSREHGDPATGGEGDGAAGGN